MQQQLTTTQADLVEARATQALPPAHTNSNATQTLEWTQIPRYLAEAAVDTAQYQLLLISEQTQRAEAASARGSLAVAMQANEDMEKAVVNHKHQLTAMREQNHQLSLQLTQQQQQQAQERQQAAYALAAATAAAATAAAEVSNASHSPPNVC